MGSAGGSNLELGSLAVVHDASYSMEYECAPNLRCLEVSSALALVQAEKEGPFQNRAIVGGREPHIIELPLGKQRLRAGQLLQAHSQNPLDLYAVLKFVLEAQVAAVERDGSVKCVHRLLLLSDRDITTAANKDHADLRAVLTASAQAFFIKGVPFPEIVFWNLLGGTAAPTLSNAPGMTLLSGFSLALLDLVLAPRNVGRPLEAADVVSRTLGCCPVAFAVPHSELWLRRGPPSAPGVEAQLLAASPPHRFRGADLCIVVETNACMSAGRRLREDPETLVAVARDEIRRRFGTPDAKVSVATVCCGEGACINVKEFSDSEGDWKTGLCNSGKNKTDLLAGLSSALSLEWRGSLRILLVIAAGLRQTPNLGKASKDLMERANALGVHILMVCLDEQADQLRQLMSRSVRLGDGTIPRIPWLKRAWPDHGRSSNVALTEVIATALAQRIALAAAQPDQCLAVEVSASAPEEVTRRSFHELAVTIEKQLDRREAGSVIGITGPRELQPSPDAHEMSCHIT
mmetsp:Transcript_158685/g.505161  ORF Transcript_158685/g.505161 Transcript_158685/m.505161 type:complete len:518 (-) Transcript_158685:375-1928(-)